MMEKKEERKEGTRKKGKREGEREGEKEKVPLYYSSYNITLNVIS